MAAHTAWVEVDLEAVRTNYRNIKGFVGSGASVMAVIKSNAYGNGLELVAKALQDEAPWFGVSTVEEGIRVREAGVKTPVLVFHPVREWNAADIVANNLTATVDGEEAANALASAGRAANVIPHAHIKVDTGMSRFGVSSKSLLASLAGRQDILCEGLYTHLATAGDADEKPSRRQLERFAGAKEAWPVQMGSLRWVHALNSSGLLRFTDTGYNMVRCGTLLFGQYPSSNVPRPIELLPTWSYRTRILSVREIKAGATVGYGAEWTASRASRIATIPVGYYDGFTVEPRSVWMRQAGLKGMVKGMRGDNVVTVSTPHGKAPVVGRVAAQSAMLDVTDMPAVAVGDIVEIPARRVMVGDHIPRVEKPSAD